MSFRHLRENCSNCVARQPWKILLRIAAMLSPTVVKLPGASFRPCDVPQGAGYRH